MKVLLIAIISLICYTSSGQSNKKADKVIKDATIMIDSLYKRTQTLELKVRELAGKLNASIQASDIKLSNLQVDESAVTLDTGYFYHDNRIAVKVWECDPDVNVILFEDGSMQATILNPDKYLKP